MPYDPDVSGPWSNTDDYPGDEIKRRHALAVRTARGLGGGEQWMGTGALGWWSDDWPAVGSLFILVPVFVCAAIAIAAILVSFL